jgi:hypothetical protein
LVSFQDMVAAVKVDVCRKADRHGEKVGTRASGEGGAPKRAAVLIQSK